MNRLSTDADRVLAKSSRFISLLIAFVFGAAAAFIGFQLVLVLLSAGVIDPAISGREWWEIYGRRVLYHDSNRWKIIPFSAIVFASVFSTCVCVFQFICGIILKPTLKLSLILAIYISVIGTAFGVGALLILGS